MKKSREGKYPITELGVFADEEEFTTIGMLHCPDDVPPEEKREILADAYDSSPDEFVLKEDFKKVDKETKRKLSVAFSSNRWNASWDPKAPKGDPSLN